MSENIKVICRIRPLNETEKENGSYSILTQLSNTTLHVEVNEDPKKKYQEKNFTFDHIASPETTQKKFYSLVGRPIVEDVLHGYNGTIFAYGQTASGKTHTMEGDLNNPSQFGIIPRYIHDIFDYIYTISENLEFQIKVSYFEIYMDKIRDLMDITKENLPVKQNKDGVPYVKGVTELFVSSPEEIFEIIRTGKTNRHVAVTNMNEHSSRSHSVFLLQVRQKNLISGKQLLGKLYMVDLAGSEKVSKTGAGGTILTEAKNINKSLSALGLVINSLVEGNNHIPYRDSKLTRILQESLGGNARTTMVICVSPASFNDHETRSTLMFGMRAKTIKNSVKINEELTAEEWQNRCERQKVLNEKLKRIIAGFQAEVAKWRNGDTVLKSDWFNSNMVVEVVPPTIKTNHSVESFSDHADETETAASVSPPSKANDSLSIAHCDSLKAAASVSPPSKANEQVQDLYRVVDDKEEEIIAKEEQIKMFTAHLNEEKEINKTLRLELDISSASNIRLQTENETSKEEVKEVLQALEELASNFDEKAIEIERLYTEVETLKSKLRESKQGETNALNDFQTLKEKRDVPCLKFYEWVLPLSEDVRAIGDIVNSNIPKPSLSVDNLEIDISNLRRYTSRIREDLFDLNSDYLSLKKVPFSNMGKEEQLTSDLKAAMGILSQVQNKSSGTGQDQVNNTPVSNDYHMQLEVNPTLKTMELMSSNDAFREENDLLKNQNESLKQNVTELMEKLDKHELDRMQKNQVKTELQVLEQTVLKELNNLKRLKKSFVDDMAQKLNEEDDNTVGSLQSIIAGSNSNEIPIVVREKMKFLEDNLTQLTTAHKNLIRERTELILDNGVMEKRMKALTERVKSLESSLREAKEDALQEKSRFTREMERFRDNVNRQNIRRKSMVAGQIVKTVRAGSHLPSLALNDSDQ